MSIELLFVYGTLRRDLISPVDNLMARHCDFYADASFQGTLYDVAGYPGVTESNNPDNQVYGELFSIRRAHQLWPLLDHYEHCSKAFPRPYEYVRKKKNVQLADGSNAQAWIYLFNWKTGGLFKIVSGNYFHYLNGS